VLVTGRFPEGYSRIYGFPGKFERQEANLGDKGIGGSKKKPLILTSGFSGLAIVNIIDN
jgi:hypothetical protein